MTIAEAILAELETSFPDPTPRELAMDLGLNKNSVRRTTRELVQAGKIVQSGYYRGAPTYQLPEPVEAVADETEYASGL